MMKKLIRIILIIAIAFQLSSEVESRIKHHRNRNNEHSWKNHKDEVGDDSNEINKFIPYQLRSPYNRNIGWKNSGSHELFRGSNHGRTSSDESRSRERKYNIQRSEGYYHGFDERINADIQNLSKGFKAFVKNLQCEESPVYQRFFAVYKKLFVKSEGAQSGWLKELANQVKEGSKYELCPVNLLCDPLKLQNANTEHNLINATNKLNMSPNSTHLPLAPFSGLKNFLGIEATTLASIAATVAISEPTTVSTISDTSTIAAVITDTPDPVPQ